jgi:DNA mismatch repair protein MutH
MARRGSLVPGWGACARFACQKPSTSERVGATSWRRPDAKPRAASRGSTCLNRDNRLGSWHLVITEPRSETELLDRARALSGLTFAEAAARLSVPVPANLLHHKGWTGQLLERLLGATANSRAVPDFEGLGVELKTLPVDGRGRPVESTFVCTISLEEIAQNEWQDSRVKRKLSCVLWMPVEGDRSIAMAERHIGEPTLWTPSEAEEATLRFDWDTLAGMIGRGDIESITGHLGVALQVRPKARNALARRWGRDEDGVRIERMPRGFYLRANFTHAILQTRYRLEPT